MCAGWVSTRLASFFISKTKPLIVELAAGRFRLRFDETRREFRKA
jgi:hypothetical protein